MKTLFIIGATATGKTDLALSLVPVFRAFPQVMGVDILSADSKQVYIGQDIVTGKDTEKYRDVHVFGIDVVHASEEWSVAHFITYAHDVFKGAQERSEEHTSELQSPDHLICPLLLYNKNQFLLNSPPLIPPHHC